MKSKQVSIMIVSLLILLMAAAIGSAATVELVPEKNVALPGEVIRIDVVVTGEDIAGVQIDLEGNGISGVTEGDMFKGLTDYGTFFNGGQTINGGVGNVYGLVLGKANFSGVGVLASFEVAEPNGGTYDLNNVIVANAKGEAMDVQTMGCTVVVREPSNDVNGNNVVDFADLVLIGQNFGKAGAWDVNCDGVTDMGDMLDAARELAGLITMGL